jgi:hypothetical protein
MIQMLHTNLIDYWVFLLKNGSSKAFITSVSMAEQSEANTVFGRSNIGITGSNPAQGMDVCLRLSVLCCPV